MCSEDCVPGILKNLLSWFLAIVLRRQSALCVSVVVLPVEGEEADWEAEGVEHLVLDGGEEDVQLLGLRRDGAGAEVRVPGYRPEQGGGGLKPQGK